MDEIQWELGNRQPNIIKNYKIIINEPKPILNPVKTRRVIQINNKLLAKSIIQINRRKSLF